MRTSAEIQAEIEEKFGFFPPFFSPALQNPQVLENLWQQTLIAYVSNPLSAVFKEKLAAYLSRFCSVPYCMVSHSCTLRPLGLSAHQVLTLLESSPPTQEDIEQHLNILAAQPVFTKLPAPHSDLEESLLICSIFIFLEREDADRYRTQLRRVLGWENYQHLAAYAAYVKTCHVWMEANPEVSYESDKRVQDNLAQLVAQEPAIAEFFRTYTGKVRQERLNKAIKQAQIAERDRNHTALQESEDRYRRLVELSPDTILIQCQGKILFVNSAGAKLFGVTSPEQLVGKLLIDFVHQSDRQAVIERMQHVDLGNSVPLREDKFIRLDGTQIETEVVASPFNYQGKIAAQVVIRDISLRKRLDRERSKLLAREQAARALAEKANRSKDEFLAIVSHELRSPLNAILGWAKLLRSRTFDTITTNRALETIERNATAQTQLIEDLLDISRIIHGKIQLKPRSTNLVKVIEAAIDTVNLAAHAKKIQIIFEPDSAIKSVTGDPERLQQVVWNLLSNAIKFTPAGGQVKVNLATVTESVSLLDYAQLAISDTGMGIDAEFLPQVFDRFLQADSTSTRSHGGLGLGLAIASQLVEMHGGNISVASLGLGLGATFTVKLPLETANSQQQPTANSHNANLTLEGVRVLIVDDEPDIRDYEVAVLELFGAKAIAVNCAAAALEALQTQKLDVLLSDIGMPGEDGYSLIKKVRNLAIAIPAIALTAYAREEDRTMVISAGFQMHLTKPVEPTQLVAAIASLVQYPTIEQHQINSSI
ncbi:hybrid sensor histidine kinase/response regulator [Synechocystis sp. PCC 7509]|uniref:hybrid sensor histidine kinase/response regulator n=1 Tax=Synechocystis sp. PCC 7509 TaxID=927677 RepID=UPI0002AC69B2|nr:ATP-binding protein [Synechocystis sp. PCC 7509]